MTKQDKVAKVMHEWKTVRLFSNGKKVTDYDQALAIAVSVAGLSKYAEGGSVRGFYEDNVYVLFKTENDLNKVIKVLNEYGGYLNLHDQITNSGKMYWNIVGNKMVLFSNIAVDDIIELSRSYGAEIEKYSKDNTKYAEGGSIDADGEIIKKGYKVTNGRGLVGIVKEIQANGLLYIQWISDNGEETRDLTADNEPEELYVISEYGEGGGVGNDNFYVKSNFGNFSVTDRRNNKMVVGYSKKEDAIITAKGLNDINDTNELSETISKLKTMKGYGHFLNQYAEGGEFEDKDDFIEDVKEMHEAIDYVVLKNENKVKEKELMERGGMYSKGGNVIERRYVNKDEDYETRYAKDKPSRMGYKDERMFKEGGETGKKLKGYRVYVFESSLSSSSNALKGDSYVLVTDGIQGDSSQVDSDEVYLKLVKRHIFGKDILHAEPVNINRGGNQMFGGKFVWSTDSRFRNDISEQPIQLHDRFESYAVGGEVGNQVNFRGDYGKKRSGIVTGKKNNGYIVATDDGNVFVESYEIDSFEEAPVAKKKRFGFFEGGGEIQSKIDKLQSVVNSKMLPESVKDKARKQIAELEKELHEGRKDKGEWTTESLESELNYYKNLLRNIDKPLYKDYNKKKVEEIISELEDKLHESKETKAEEKEEHKGIDSDNTSITTNNSNTTSVSTNAAVKKVIIESKS
jgi:hypothetical protein